MKTRAIQLCFLVIAVTALVSTSSCIKSDAENKSTLRKLYRKYKCGKISECKYYGETAYEAQADAYDATLDFYDKDGKYLGFCDYAWNTPDSVCGKVKDCQLIYMGKKNIWGQPPYDKYGLRIW
jgi:hypothetical protein